MSSIRKHALLFVLVLASGVLASSAVAATIKGSARTDILRGTAAADKLYGFAGNDKLYGLAGSDYVNGGPGNDVVVGGPGPDTLVCGPGRDTAMADAGDKIAADCESVQGLPKPALSVADVSQAEGSAGSQSATFTVTLAKASPLRATVSYATADGTASAGSDYTATSGQLEFAPGETSKTIAVPIVGDTALEQDETFTLALSNPINAQLGRATATATITNDDHPPAKPGTYTGSISSGGVVAFNVGADGNALTNLAIVFSASCQPQASLTDSVRLSGTIPIQPDGSFTADGSGDGITVKFNGKFTTSGDVVTASGNLQIHVSTDYQGTHYECDTGSSTWSATWRG